MKDLFYTLTECLPIGYEFRVKKLINDSIAVQVINTTNFRRDRFVTTCDELYEMEQSGVLGSKISRMIEHITSWVE
jgi:hypothetical protein